jgi:hypothetical protein
METTRRQFLRLGGTYGLAAGAVAFGGYAFAGSREDRPRDVRIGDVNWRASLDEARRVAVRDDKPILLLNLFGRLDQEFC